MLVSHDRTLVCRTAKEFERNLNKLMNRHDVSNVKSFNGQSHYVIWYTEHYEENEEENV